MLKALKALLDFFLPRDCVSCGKSNPRGRFGHLCEDCAAEIYYLNGGVCLRCAEIVGAPKEPCVRACAECAELMPHFDAALAACVFTGAPRELLLNLKYGGARHLAADVAALFDGAARFAEFAKGATLVPVPLHSARLKKRKYNQSLEIARAIKRRYPQLELKIAEPLLRKKQTLAQASLDKKTRLQNIRGAFGLKPKAAAKLKKETPVIIFDDVMTTGATLDECARVLKRAGFKNVRALCAYRRL